MKIPDFSNNRKKHMEILSLPFLIIYYFIVRMLTGVSYGAIYGFIIILLLVKTSFEQIAFSFFLMGVVVYVFGRNTEANHYFSFFYGFLFLSLLKYLYLIFRDRLKNNPVT